jgi:hypothetical protein
MYEVSKHGEAHFASEGSLVFVVGVLSCQAEAPAVYFHAQWLERQHAWRQHNLNIPMMCNPLV